MNKFLGLALLSVFLIASCRKPNNVETDKFDRNLMLKNYAENIIVPAYKDVQSSVNQMNSAIAAFVGNASLENLVEAQSAWTAAYGEWQYANAFNVGPAAEQGLNRSMKEEISTFPVSATKIDDAANTGQYNFNDFNRDARGFLALEYMLFGSISLNNNEVLGLFESQPFRKNYLKDCGLNIKTRVDKVVSDWEAGYTADFISRNGTDVGSSTSQLYNEFVRSFETNKNFKVELPLGKRPGQTQPEPQLVEAYYSGKSVYFLKMHLKAIENIYYGKSKSGADGLGFKDYLESVTGGPDLVKSTLIQWANVMAAINALPENVPLSQLITDNPQQVENLRVELQKHTRFFKSDMSSLLGIAITYSSGDGD
jgi:uncharacterized protein